MNHTVNISQPKIVFVSPSVRDKVVKVAQKNTFLKTIVVFDENNDKFHNELLVPYSKFVNNYKVSTNDIKRRNKKCDSRRRVVQKFTQICCRLKSVQISAVSQLI